MEPINLSWHENDIAEFFAELEHDEDALKLIARSLPPNLQKALFIKIGAILAHKNLMDRAYMYAIQARQLLDDTNIEDPISRQADIHSLSLLFAATGHEEEALALKSLLENEHHAQLEKMDPTGLVE